MEEHLYIYINIIISYNNNKLYNRLIFPFKIFDILLIHIFFIFSDLIKTKWDIIPLFYNTI